MPSAGWCAKVRVMEIRQPPGPAGLLWPLAVMLLVFLLIELFGLDRRLAHAVYYDDVTRQWLGGGAGDWWAHRLVHDAGRFYALIAVCTHLGCTPNYLASEDKFKCPCHGSGFRLTGINFEGPAPRPLERAAIGLADDGQIQVDKSRHFQFELGQWSDAESFLKA